MTAELGYRPQPDRISDAISVKLKEVAKSITRGADRILRALGGKRADVQQDSFLEMSKQDSHRRIDFETLKKGQEVTLIPGNVYLIGTPESPAGRAHLAQDGTATRGFFIETGQSPEARMTLNTLKPHQMALRVNEQGGIEVAAMYDHKHGVLTQSRKNPGFVRYQQRHQNPQEPQFGAGAQRVEWIPLSDDIAFVQAGEMVAGQIPMIAVTSQPGNKVRIGLEFHESGEPLIEQFQLALRKEDRKKELAEVLSPSASPDRVKPTEAQLMSKQGVSVPLEIGQNLTIASYEGLQGWGLRMILPDQNVYRGLAAGLDIRRTENGLVLNNRSARAVVIRDPTQKMILAERNAADRGITEMVTMSADTTILVPLGEPGSNNMLEVRLDQTTNKLIVKDVIDEGAYRSYDNLMNAQALKNAQS